MHLSVWAVVSLEPNVNASNGTHLADFPYFPNKYANTIVETLLCEVVLVDTRQILIVLVN